MIAGLDLDSVSDLVSRDDMEEALNGITKSNLPKNFKDDCPCLNYILEKLKNLDEDNFLCNMVKAQEAASNFPVNIVISDTEGTRITSGQSQDNKSSSIFIPKNFCALGMAKDIQTIRNFIHELLHTNYHLVEFQGIGLDQDWETAVMNYHNIEDGNLVTGNHHYLFYEYLRDQIASSLRDMNIDENTGLPVGSVSVYYYQAHLIINKQQLADAENGNAVNSAGDPIPIPQWIFDLDEDKRNELLQFDVQSLKEAWDDIGGDSNFKLNC